jgi:uncharacterized protein YdeI (YjbR/CyaY-like superfamily)
VAPAYFQSPAAFRAWLADHHATVRELLVGFHKKGTGLPSITYPEALDEALCFGWIDGVRRNVNETSYTIRFTPRKQRSRWSAVNIRHAERLIADGRMRPAGHAAYERRHDAGLREYSYEATPRELTEAYRRRFAAKKRAWAFFQAQPPGYRRVAQFWVMSAKREETRRKRLDILVSYSAGGERIPPLAPPTSVRKAR